MRSSLVLGAAVLSVLLARGPVATAGAEEDAAVEQGRRLTVSKCLPCHKLEPGAHLVGPSLAGLFDRPAGTAPGFRRYSAGLSGSGLRWDDGTLAAYLRDPGAMIPDNRMIFVGLSRPEETAAVIAYLRQAAR